jgi:16S rRNA U516 pseudouridylate synthase RsuA-like enzyme
LPLPASCAQGSVGDYTVRAIHRVSFMGISLDGIEAPGAWALLNAAEMELVRQCIEQKGQEEGA